jgi:hypothetical protein
MLQFVIVGTLTVMVTKYILDEIEENERCRYKRKLDDISKSYLSQLDKKVDIFNEEKKRRIIRLLQEQIKSLEKENNKLLHSF